uniref:Uncharacterized protein n=1 Tax=Arundo donax TaxID=35708 RepID=A0A0A9GB84_ARUDO
MLRGKKGQELDQTTQTGPGAKLLSIGFHHGYYPSCQARTDDG